VVPTGLLISLIVVSSAEPDIGDYAVIGDCRTAALVSRDGSMDWLCLPDFSSPSVFAALLDRKQGGCFAIRPARPFRACRRYVGTTAVLETSFETDSGKARLIDLLPIVAPDALHPTREILRIVEGTAGEVAFDLRFEPRPDYARANPRVRSRGALGWACAWSDELLLLRAGAALEITGSGDAVTGRVRVHAGEKIAFSLSYSKADIGVAEPLDRAAEGRLQETLRWWRDWSGRCRYDGPHREAVLRSAITLKLMTFALSGAVVAAPTTSLPEAVGADRNWDYRYCWLRDAALTMRAFTGLGYQDEAGSFLHWLLHATRLTWPKLKVMYDVYGRSHLREYQLPHFAGYRGSRPVRVGNGAHRQIQLDVYGGVVSAAFDYIAHGGRIQSDEARILGGLGRTVCKDWRDPDHGIWEIRGAKRQYTFSKVMCWATLDCLVKLHDRGQVRVDRERFTRERDAIAQAIETRGYNDRLDSYVSELDGDRLDASLLLIGWLGYKQAGDARMKGTFARIQERLGNDDLIHRYEPGYDGLPSREGAFGICSFWAVDNLACRGEQDSAEHLFEKLLCRANDVGLFAEEIDPTTGKALGNFPQAFTHVGLINAAIAVAEGRHRRQGAE
jgi:GH15 family glucan-1,4-alpha-glucosidase